MTRMLLTAPLGPQLSAVVEPAVDAGFALTLCASAKAAVAALKADPLQVVLLDPAAELGWTVAGAVRAADPVVPIVGLTAEVGTDAVRWLDVIDRLLSSSSGPTHVLAEVRALARRCFAGRTGRFVHGSLMVDTDALAVTLEGVPVRLAASEACVVDALVRSAGACVGRSVLAAHVRARGGDARGRRFVDDSVSRARTKLAAAGAPADLIETVHGRGYRLRATGALARGGVA